MVRGISAEPRIYARAITASALFGLLTVAISRVIGWITNTYVMPIIESDTPVVQVWQGAAVLTVVIVALTLSIAARRIFAAQGTYALQARHRVHLADRLVDLPPAWHRATSPGKILSHASSDAEAATSVFNPLPFALGVVVMLLTSTVMLVLIDPAIALAALAIIPVMMIANILFQRKMSPAVTTAQQLRADVSETAHESFEAATLVKAMGTAQVESARFREDTTRLLTANTRVGALRAVFDPIIDALPHLGSLLVLLVGVQRLATQDITAGDVVTATYLMSLLSVPVRSFGWVLAELPRSVVGYQRVAEVVDTPNPMPPGHVSPDWDVHEPLEVSVRDVSVVYREEQGEQRVLDEVSLTIPAGSLTVLMGRTGAGKTTLVSLCARLADPSEGEVRLGGFPVAELTHDAITRHVAFVSQSPFIFDDTVRHNVTLNNEMYSDDQVWQALEDAHIADHVRSMPRQLDTHLGERGSSLSGGQRQRIALARALITQPSVLILDDATSALDPQVEQAILRTVKAKSRATVVMVAYRSASAQLADHLAVLSQGRIVAQGDHKHLMESSEEYRDLVMAYDNDAERRQQEGTE